jgi:dynein heavy chain 1
LAFFKEFANVVGVLQEKSISLMEISAKVTQHIEELSECPYDFDSFAGILSRLQKIADDLNLQDFANLDAWVDSLDQRIQRVLVQRVSNEIDNWCKAFSSHRQLSVSDDDRQTAAITNEPIVHELRIKNQLIYVDPPVEMTQATWTKQLQRIMGKFGSMSFARVRLIIQIQVSFADSLLSRACGMSSSYTKPRLRARRISQYWLRCKIHSC